MTTSKEAVVRWTLIGGNHQYHNSSAVLFYDFFFNVPMEDAALGNHGLGTRLSLMPELLSVDSFINIPQEIRTR